MSRAGPLRPNSSAKAGHASLLVQPGVDHFGIVMSLSEPDAPLVQAIARQMGLGGARLDLRRFLIELSLQESASTEL